MDDYKKRWYLENRERILAQRKEEYYENPDKFRGKSNKYYYENHEEELAKRTTRRVRDKEKLSEAAKIRWISMSCEQKMYRRAKERSRLSGTDFDISLEDIIIPEFCPILDIKLDREAKAQYNTPSIDRVNNNLGYVRGNIRVISNKANRLKADLTPEICQRLMDYWND